MIYQPPARARDTLIVISVFAAVACATAFCRFKSRKVRKIAYGPDDFLMLAALSCLFISIGIQFACVFAGGTGQHVEDVAPLDIVKTLKLILPFEILYGITLCLSKTSVIFFYLRLFGPVRKFRISAYIAICILVLWAISILLETLLLCRPLAYNWDATIPGGVCGSRNKTYVAAGSLNVVTDFMVMALPVPHIWALQLGKRKKVGLLGMFSLGTFITVVSVLRIKSLEAISFTDLTFTVTMGLFWSTFEPCLCIINSNLPMLWALLAAKYPSVFRNTDRSFGSHNVSSGRNGAAGVGYNGAGGAGDIPLANRKKGAKKITRVGTDNFEMLDDEFDGNPGGKNVMRTKTVIRGGRGVGSDDGSVESERHLTGSITMTRCVDVERDEYLSRYTKG